LSRKNRQLPRNSGRAPLASILNLSRRSNRRAFVTRPEADDWTIERWKTEPKLVGLELTEVDQGPPLWKDLTLASAVAVLVWVVALIVFR
jgi:hypothetical protein